MTTSTAMTETEIAPEDVPLPRDSMVTVRLSDAQELAPTSELTEESAFEEIRPGISFSQEIEVLEEPEEASRPDSTNSSSRRSSTSSRQSRLSSTTNSVDWEELEKTEEQTPKDECTDESTALLLARLEQENNAIATDPKANISSSRNRSETRPPSIHQLRKLVNGPQRQSLRYSQIPAPHMTELEFWAALVQDYPQTAQRLPTLTSNKIRGGVPPILRGVVWPSIAGAHDEKLHQDFERLSQEPSPYDGLIGKDVGRSFPNVEMFKEKDGEGQQMLRRVLKAFSLYDEEIGYCQGLGFVVGPLLMHMGEAEAFAVLVQLMQHYNLRSCYTPDLAGLHLRIYQFQTLLSRHLPQLTTRLAELSIEPLYVSQWFLSFFAVTCPLPMLLRIYDIILAEGATETLMRVALSLMQRNEKKIMAFQEFEEVMQFLLSRSLWDTYAQHADDMVADFVSLTNLVSRESLQNLEADFKASQTQAAPSPLKSAAASLLGRFWAGSSHTTTKSGHLGLSPTGGHSLRKTASGTSLTSTMASNDTHVSEASTAPTEVSDLPRVKSEVISLSSDSVSLNNSQSPDRDLHSQIEDLLTALSKLQHQQHEMARDLQREREEREEDRIVASTLMRALKDQRTKIQQLQGDEIEHNENDAELDQILDKASRQFTPADSRRVSILQTKHQLRDAADEWKEKAEAEAARVKDLSRRLDESETEHNSLRESLREARQRVQDSHRDKQRLERTVQELRARSSPVPDSPSDVYTPVSEKTEIELRLPQPKGKLREFRLGKSEAPRPSSMVFSKRTSSLQAQNIFASSEQTQSPESLLLELVNAKTAEAVAKQELEETRGKLDALRKIISGGASTPTPPSRTASGSESATPPLSTPPIIADNSPDTPKASASHAPSRSIGGFFSGWGKKST